MNWDWKISTPPIFCTRYTIVHATNYTIFCSDHMTSEKNTMEPLKSTTTKLEQNTQSMTRVRLSSDRQINKSTWQPWSEYVIHGALNNDRQNDGWFPLRSFLISFDVIGRAQNMRLWFQSVFLINLLRNVLRTFWSSAFSNKIRQPANYENTIWRC